MATRVYSNIADETTLSGNIIAGAATIAVVSVTGWPVPAAGQIALGCLEYDSATGSAREIFSYTGIAGTSFTGCVRGLDGTTDQGHNSGVKVIHVASAYDVPPKPAVRRFNAITWR